MGKNALRTNLVQVAFVRVSRMKKFVVALMLSAVPFAANAAVVLSSVPGNAVYAGPAPTYDFDSAATTPTVTGGLVTTGSLSGIRAQPLGSIGNYLTVSPADGSPATLDFSPFGPAVASISFIWGSVDAYNTLQVLSAANTVLATFTGSNVSALANGNQSAPSTNPFVTLSLTGVDQTAARKLRFFSTSNAFEVDNFVLSAPIPEASTWGMMIAGFGIVGAAARRRSRRVASQLA
jgi:PEP-CTERM motif